MLTHVKTVVYNAILCQSVWLFLHLHGFCSFSPEAIDFEIYSSNPAIMVLITKIYVSQGM